MAITYPRQLLSYHLSECSIELNENTSYSLSRGNLLNVSQFVPETWQIVVTTGLLYPEQQMPWSAWKKSLRGGMQTFIAYDTKRQRPQAYPNANSPADIGAGWNGTATVVSRTPTQIRVSGIPATYQAKAGDRIGLEENGKYGYYEIIEDATVSAGTLLLSVFPFVHTTLFTTSAVARLWRPTCQFILDWQSWAEPTTREAAPISFQGYQRL